MTDLRDLKITEYDRQIVRGETPSVTAGPGGPAAATTTPQTAVQFIPQEPHFHIQFSYKNWRGETTIRKVIVYHIEWCATRWHPEPQWVLHALDLGRNETRSFAMRDMKDVDYVRA